MEKERREAGWKSWDEARVTAADRKRWRESVEESVKRLELENATNLDGNSSFELTPA